MFNSHGRFISLKKTFSTAIETETWKIEENFPKVNVVNKWLAVTLNFVPSKIYMYLDPNL